MFDGLSEQTTDAVETSTVWCLQVGVEGGPWVQMGAHNADAAVVLRTHDYRAEHFPDEVLRIARVDVITTVEDISDLREQLRKKDSSAKNSAVQSD